MKGRKPKPTHLKVIAGNPGKRPLNEDEPEFAPDLPEPPAFLSEEAKTEWDRVAGELYAKGVLTAMDRGALAVCCQLYGRLVQAETALAELAEKDPSTHGLLIKTGRGAAENPLVGIARRSMDLYLRGCAEFGMTPSSRSRIKAVPKDGDLQNPFYDHIAPSSRWPE